MTNIKTELFSDILNDLFYEDVKNSSEHNYYITLGKTLAFSDDENPPTPNNSTYATSFGNHEEILYGFFIANTDVERVIQRNDWVSNTVYQYYDDKLDNLSNTQFFTITSDEGKYSVFKCLNNNGGSASTDKPLSSETSADDIYYSTSDGYEWKYMGSITVSNYNKFKTANLVPFTADANVVSNAVNGSLDSFIVDSGGENYNSYANGSIQQINVGSDTKKYQIVSGSDLSSNTGFYENCAFYITSGPGQGQIRTVSDYEISSGKRYITVDEDFDAGNTPTISSTYEIVPRVVISGDGANSSAKAVMNTTSNTIYRVVPLERGTDYSYANVYVTGNTGVAVANSASVTPIISPKNGHGSDPLHELSSMKLCISIGVEEGDFPVSENDYRTISLIRNPVFEEQVLTLDNYTGFDEETGIVISSKNVSATISSSNSSANTITLSNITGIIEAGDTVTGTNNSVTANVDSLSETFTKFDNRDFMETTVIYTGPTGDGFQLDEKINQENTDAEGYIHYIDGSNLYITMVKGEFNNNSINIIEGVTSGAQATVDNVTKGDIVKAKEDVLLIQNIEPVSRQAGQDEIIKLVIGF